MTLRTLTLDALEIRDERCLEGVPLYARLKQMLLTDGAVFRVLDGDAASWDRALFFNLAYWSADAPSDVLTDASVDADVVAHIAWHHAARKALHAEGDVTCDALLLGEAVASAFDLFLVGSLISMGERSPFLDTQVPAMAEAARNAGMPQHAFEALLHDVASDPAAAFEELRALLFDVTTRLVSCDDVDAADAVLAGADDERLSPLLHHFALSAWIGSAQRLGRAARAPDPRARAAHAAMRAAPVALDWIARAWLPAA